MSSISGVSSVISPFSWEWRNIFKIEGQGGLRYHVKSMIAHFVPGTGNSDEDKQSHLSLQREFEVRM